MKVSIYCPHCQRHTALTFGMTEISGDYGVRYSSPAIWEQKFNKKWWIGVCNFCNEPSLVLNAGENIYPRPFPSPTDERIPEPMLSDLKESKICFSSETYRACAVMARRALQSACINKGSTKKNLVDQIEELKQEGIITSDLREWATVVRWVGNDAAHPNKEVVDRESAEDILNLAEQFLHILYVAPAIALNRKEQRQKKE